MRRSMRVRLMPVAVIFLANAFPRKPGKKCHGERGPPAAGPTMGSSQNHPAHRCRARPFASPGREKTTAAPEGPGRAFAPRANPPFRVAPPALVTSATAPAA
ncbi:hypothetical protein GCM10023178_19250 [Actinomadura luteofluorescens]